MSLSFTRWAAAALRPTLLDLQRLLPHKITSRPVRSIELIMTVVMLVVLLFLSVAALFQHLKYRFVLRGAPGLGRTLRVALHTWVTLSLALSACVYLGEGTYQMVTMMLSGRPSKAEPVRLVWFWTFQCLCAVVDTGVGVLSLPPLVQRLLAAAAPSLLQPCTRSRVGQLVAALDGLDTSEILLTRLLFMGGTFAMALYGR